MIFTKLLVIQFLLILSVKSDDDDYVAKGKKLVVIMLDGFRHDYLYKIPENQLGGFNAFINRGTRAKYVAGSFPTVSYPAWTTLSTGLYPENHNIIGNYFFNKENNALFKLNEANNEIFYWNMVESIWTTAMNQNVATATINWSRSNVSAEMMHGNRTSAKFLSGYEPNESNTVSDMLENVLNQLDEGCGLINQGCQFVMAYAEFIDNVGHGKGPDSHELKSALIDVAKSLDIFFIRLSSRMYGDQVNVILVSDHGMADLSPLQDTKFVYVSSYCSYHCTDILYSMDQGPFMYIYTKQNTANYVYDQLKLIQEENGVMIYLKHQIPACYRLAKSKWAPDILLVAKPGTYLIGLDDYSQIPKQTRPSEVCGVHGYDEVLDPDMRTIFMAYGPDFRDDGEILDEINLVDIYQLYPYLLNINASNIGNNGTWDNVKCFLQQYKNECATEWFKWFIMLIIVAAIGPTIGALIVNLCLKC